jgi:hypothetical protein
MQMQSSAPQAMLMLPLLRQPSKSLHSERGAVEPSMQSSAYCSMLMLPLLRQPSEILQSQQQCMNVNPELAVHFISRNADVVAAAAAK